MSPRKTEDYINSVIWNRFLPLPGVDRRRLRLNLEGAYSLTPHHVSQAVIFEAAQLMQHHWQTPLMACSMLECFAGQGGDTAAFLACARPHTLYAVEHNVANFNNLVNNMAEYQRACPVVTAVHFIRDNAVEVLRKAPHQRYDVVYMDPPWGGPTYRRQTRHAALLVPHASPVTVWELVLEVLPRCKLVILKVPVGYELGPVPAGCAMRTTVYDDKIRFVYFLNLHRK